MNCLIPEPIQLNYKDIRVNRQINNNNKVYDCIQENNQERFHELINQEELKRVLAEREYYNPGYGSFDLFWNKCRIDKEYAQMAAGRLSKDASRQGVLDEIEQLKACNTTSEQYRIAITKLSPTGLRLTNDGKIITEKERKQQNLKDSDYAKSFDGQIDGIMKGYIAAKITYGKNYSKKGGGFQNTVFREMYDIAERWKQHFKDKEEILVILIETDLTGQFMDLKNKYNDVNNIMVFNHVAFQQYIIDTYHIN